MSESKETDDLKEALYLLRQIYYARNPLGQKFGEDKLEEYKLEDLRERILKAISERE